MSTLFLLCLLLPTSKSGVDLSMHAHAQIPIQVKCRNAWCMVKIVHVKSYGAVLRPGRPLLSSAWSSAPIVKADTCLAHCLEHTLKQWIALATRAT
eukprot:364577-Chlamydomonas_euryale.AAC.4